MRIHQKHILITNTKIKQTNKIKFNLDPVLSPDYSKHSFAGLCICSIYLLWLYKVPEMDCKVLRSSFGIYLKAFLCKVYHQYIAKKNNLKPDTAKLCTAHFKLGDLYLN